MSGARSGRSLTTNWGGLCCVVSGRWQGKRYMAWQPVRKCVSCWGYRRCLTVLLTLMLLKLWERRVLGHSWLYPCPFVIERKNVNAQSRTSPWAEAIFTRNSVICLTPFTVTPGRGQQPHSKVSRSPPPPRPSQSAMCPPRSLAAHT